MQPRIQFTFQTASTSEQDFTKDRTLSKIWFANLASLLQVIHTEFSHHRHPLFWTSRNTWAAMEQYPESILSFCFEWWPDTKHIYTADCRSRHIHSRLCNSPRQALEILSTVILCLHVFLTGSVGLWLIANSSNWKMTVHYWSSYVF